MNINYIRTREGLAAAVPDIMKTTVVGIDSETSGFTTRVADMTLLQIAVNPEEVHVLNIIELLDWGASFDWLYDLLASDQIKVFQNAKFDLQFLQKLLQRRLRVKNLNDTMLASILLAFGDKRQRHGLGVIAQRELGEYVDKGLQKSDFSGPHFSEEQIQYAAHDAAIPLKIRDKQLTKVSESGLKRCARLEFDAVAVLAEMEFKGIYVDQAEWMERARHQQQEFYRLETEIKEMVGPYCEVQLLWGEPSINLSSPLQLKNVLHRMGVMIPDTDEDTLKLFEKKHPVMEKILEFREVETARKKFGENYARFFDPHTGRIHGSFRQIEAPTGRMSCTDPNLMQVPTKGDYRKAFKSQVPGGKIITADYSQIELRVMAKMSGDKELTRAFLNDEDLHNKTTHLVLGEPLDNPNPAKRKIGKFLNFGTAYGTSPETFAGLAGITKRQAEVVLRDYWKVYYGLDSYMKRMGNLAVSTGIMKTASGRTGKLLLDMEDPKMRGRANRLGRNFSIQGTGADILKTALYRVREDFLDMGLDAYVVNAVHDEIVVEAFSDAETVAHVLEEAMNEAAKVYLEEVPCKVDIRVRDHWSK